jgi:glucose/arabinose dehydrogenase
MRPLTTRTAGIRPRRALLRPVGALVALALLAGCSNGNAGGQPTWVPQPNFQANAEPEPQLPGNGLPAPQPSAPGGGNSAPQAPGTTPSPGTSPTKGAAVDPAVVATKLNQPTGLVVLPDGTALVGERTTGRILQVQPVAGKPVRLVQTLAGVDGTGDGGLLDLALSPTYSQDGLIYAYLTTAQDNRVVHFPLGSTPSPVIVGIPKGRTGNAGRIAFDATGALLTGTGDAGNPSLAADRTSLAGKILRTDDIGQPAAGNPTAGSPIYASGFQSVDGLCVDPQSGTRLEISAGRPDEINLIKSGASYGYPRDPAGTAAVASLPSTSSGGGGCALVNGRIVIATSTGTALVSASIDQNGAVGAFTAGLKGKYGRLRTVVAGSDGALWITTGNRDGHGKPLAVDDRVIRISAESGGGSSPL